LVLRIKFMTQKSKSNQMQENEGEILDFNKPSYKFIPPGYHEWVQRGYYLVCKSCELEHGTFIGPHKLLTGIDEKGKPILRNRRDLGMV